MAYNKAFNPDALPAYAIPPLGYYNSATPPLTSNPAIVMQSPNRLLKPSVSSRRIANNLVRTTKHP